MIANLVAFSLAAALIVLIPGPDTLVVLRSVALQGRAMAVRTAGGVLCGLCVWVSAAALGLTALLRASQDGYLALRLAGAAYLLFVGVQALRNRALASPDTNGTAASGVPGRSLIGRGFKAGLMTDLLNPKVGVFFITFLPAFIPSHSAAPAITFGLGAIFVIETAAYFAVMIMFVRRLTAWLNTERVRRRLNRATGLVLIGFGVRLAARG
ncbi:MAG TPA: LysE family translocator [Acidimicrobiales bacterium]|nr:LysE family translocator [Acidimicrobiales bacterium]